jgi:hypothetical protein
LTQTACSVEADTSSIKVADPLLTIVPSHTNQGSCELQN